MGAGKKVGKIIKAVNFFPKNVYEQSESQVAASFGARGAGLSKIGFGAAAPVVIIVPCVTVGLLGGPFGVAAGAIAGVFVGTFVAVPTIVWGVGDLIMPEVFYKRKHTGQQ